jgi:hypothetical protein
MDHRNLSLPSVTEVLGPLNDFSMILPATLAHAARRGTRVHAACAALALGLFALPLDSECQPYVDSFEQWFNSAVAEVIEVENRFYDWEFGYCGKVDLIARLKGDDSLSVIDLKTPTQPQKTWGVQLAAYAHLARYSGFQVKRTFCLRLSREGKRPKKPDEYTSQESQLFSIFLSQLNVWKFMEGCK